MSKRLWGKPLFSPALLRPALVAELNCQGYGIDGEEELHIARKWCACGHGRHVKPREFG